MSPVTVANNYDLVALKVKTFYHSVGHPLHNSTIDSILRIEAESEMIDWLCNADILRRCRAHDLPRQFGVISRKISRGTPRYPFGLVSGTPSSKVMRQRPKASSTARHPDQSNSLLELSNKVEHFDYCDFEFISVWELLMLDNRGNLSN